MTNKKYICPLCENEIEPTKSFMAHLIYNQTVPPTGGLDELTTFHGNQHNYSWTWRIGALTKLSLTRLIEIYEEYK